MFFLAAILLPVGIVSCSKASVIRPSVGENQTTPVKLALGLGSDNATKASVDVITEMKPSPEFRGLHNVRVVPFQSSSTVGEEDKTLSSILPLPDISGDGIIPGNNAYNYTGGGLHIPVGTASALIYGRAPWGPVNTVALRHKWGSLREIGFEKKGTEWAYVTYAGELGFEPHTMLVKDTGSPQEAEDIAGILSRIVIGDTFQITACYDFDVDGRPNKSKTVSMAWDGTIQDDNLRSCYENVTMSGALMPGSGENVEALLTNLYRGVYNYNIVNSTPYEIVEGGEIYQDVKWQDTSSAAEYKPLTYGVLYTGVKNMLVQRFHNLKPDPGNEKPGDIDITSGDNPEVHFVREELSSYPERYGLPSGAAVVRWTPTGYVVPLEHGLDGIAPISHYCYPPPLYYFSNSTLRTSNDESQVAGLYTYEKSWNQIKDGYKDGSVVSSSTKAVVFETKLEYAVSMLCATVRAASEYLQDNDGRDDTQVHATGDNLPLTGVIIGRQYPTYFDFTPKYESDTESTQYYLYDDQVPEGISLHVKGENETLKEFRTLALETPIDTEVYFALEFLNNTDSFQGAEGRILRGHKFYLVGKLYFPEGTEYDRIFIKDRITVAPCVVNTLKYAHNAVPDLGIPQLNLGVELEANWKMSNPVSLILGDDDSEQ